MIAREMNWNWVNRLVRTLVKRRNENANEPRKSRRAPCV